MLLAAVVSVLDRLARVVGVLGREHLLRGHVEVLVHEPVAVVVAAVHDLLVHAAVAVVVHVPAPAGIACHGAPHAVVRRERRTPPSIGPPDAALV